MSASFPQATIECHSVFSWRWPSWPVQLREVASLKFATRCPPGVVRTSGSEPRFPTRMTLFTPATMHPQCLDGYVGTKRTVGSRRVRRQDASGGPIDAWQRDGYSGWGAGQDRGVAQPGSAPALGAGG